MARQRREIVVAVEQLCWSALKCQVELPERVRCQGLARLQKQAPARLGLQCLQRLLQPRVALNLAE